MRVSTDQQAKHGDSLREQQDTLRNFVKQSPDMKIYDEYIDDGISGQKIDRDEFNRLIDDVKNDKVDIILFTKLDRWFRNLKHYLNVQEILEKHNVAWKAISQDYYDTSTPIGRNIVQQMMGFAELEAQLTSERIKAVFKNKVEQGEIISGNVAFGYKINNKKLAINEEEACIVRFAFDYYLKCNSIRKTQIEIIEKLDYTRDYNFYKRLLRNERYIGKYRGNNNFCPKIVSDDIFNKVQVLLSKNVPVSAKRIYLFSKLIRCKNCGHPLSGITVQPKRVLKDGTIKKNIIKQYRCQYYHYIPKKCNYGKVTAESKIEKYLLNFVQDELKNYLFDIEKTNDKKLKNKMDHKATIKKLETKLTRLKTAYLNEVIELEEYKKDKEEIENHINSLECLNQEITSVPKRAIEQYNQILGDDFKDRYTKFSDLEKKQFWANTIDYITIENDNEIHIKFL